MAENVHPEGEMLNWWFVGGGMDSCLCSKAAGRCWRCFPPGSGSTGMNLFPPCAESVGLRVEMSSDDGGGKLGINREKRQKLNELEVI